MWISCASVGLLAGGEQALGGEVQDREEQVVLPEVEILGGG
jgi:hypothetical protein